MKSQPNSRKGAAGGNQIQPLRGGTGRPVTYKMTLFVAGGEPNSIIARQNIETLCAERLNGACRLEVVDVLENPAAAIDENVLVSPALIVHSPKKIKVFGTLEDTPKLLSALELI